MFTVPTKRDLKVGHFSSQRDMLLFVSPGGGMTLGIFSLPPVFHVSEDSTTSCGPEDRSFLVLLWPQSFRMGNSRRASSSLFSFLSLDLSSAACRLQRALPHRGRMLPMSIGAFCFFPFGFFPFEPP